MGGNTKSKASDKSKSRKSSSNAEEDLPSTLERSDKHAQKLWESARKSAIKTYGRGASAMRVAWAALKNEYKKQGDRWVRKAHKGPSDPQAARGPTTKPKSTNPNRAPTARGKVAKTPAQARKKAKQAKKEYARNYRARQKK